MISNMSLGRFNPGKQIKFGKGEAKAPTIVLIGRRDTGKSCLIKDILSHFTDVPVGTVISGTEEGNGFFGSIVPRMFIHTEYRSDIIGKILKRQKLEVGNFHREMERRGMSDIDARTFVIMDDCLYDDSWARDKLMRLIFMNGRHWKIMLVITMQYPLGIPPSLRSNIDFVFILRNNITKDRQRIYENYAGMFPTFEAFCQVMDQCTNNYECLVIANNVQSNKLCDQVFWYKADTNRPPYRLGLDEFWNLSESIRVADHEDEYDPTQFKKRAAGPKIHVKKIKM